MMRVAPHHSVLVESDVSLEGLHGLVSGTFSLLRDYRVIELLPDKLVQIVKIPVVVVLLQLDRAVAVDAFVRPLDEVRIEDVSDLGRHQGVTNKSRTCSARAASIKMLAVNTLTTIAGLIHE